MTAKEMADAAKERFCYSCKKPTITLVRLNYRKALTRNETKICQNEKCPMFINIKKVKNWIIKNTGHYKRDFKTENRPEFNPALSHRKFF